MTYVLGKPVVVGGFTITIVSQQAAIGHKIGRRGVALRCRKEPAFVVVQDGHDRKVLDMTGAKVPFAQLAALCPAVQALSK